MSIRSDCAHRRILRENMNKPSDNTPIRLTQLAHGGG
jgi:hypothetical protein